MAALTCYTATRMHLRLSSHYKGRLVETLLEAYQNASALIACPRTAEPKPGQYVQIENSKDVRLGVPLSFFLAGPIEPPKNNREIQIPVSGPLPESWMPGDDLALRGPLGRGFTPPQRLRRVALVAMGGSPGPLLPLIAGAAERGAEIVIFCDSPIRELPAAVEVRGLDAAAEAIGWADYLAIICELENAEELRDVLKVKERLPRALAAQVLVRGPMPCGGLAQCGVCAVATNKGERLACEDGPVFDLEEFV